MGFKNWKKAMDDAAGFPKHESSRCHKHAAASKQESELRIASHSTIATMILGAEVEDNRYYIKILIEVLTSWSWG